MQNAAALPTIDDKMVMLLEHNNELHAEVSKLREKVNALGAPAAADTRSARAALVHALMHIEQANTLNGFDHYTNLEVHLVYTKLATPTRIVCRQYTIKCEKNEGTVQFIGTWESSTSSVPFLVLGRSNGFDYPEFVVWDTVERIEQQACNALAAGGGEWVLKCISVQTDDTCTNPSPCEVWRNANPPRTTSR